jgi:hypothetical protein
MNPAQKKAIAVGNQRLKELLASGALADLPMSERRPIEQATIDIDSLLNRIRQLTQIADDLSRENRDLNYHRKALIDASRTYARKLKHARYLLDHYPLDIQNKRDQAAFNDVIEE